MDIALIRRRIPNTNSHVINPDIIPTNACHQLTTPVQSRNERIFRMRLTETPSQSFEPGKQHQILTSFPLVCINRP